MGTRSSEVFAALGAAVVAVAGACAGCGGGAKPPHLEDAARETVPIPACVVALQPRVNASGLRNLTEDELWHVVFPTYDVAKRQLPVGAETCTGERVFDEPDMIGATPRGNAIDVKEGDILFGNAGDRLRIVWFRTHRWPDGSEGGTLALVRATEAAAEVYAVGIHKRPAAKTTLQSERIGSESIITAIDDGCEDQPKSAPCASTVTLYHPSNGHLDQLKTLTTEQRAFGSGSEPGIIGQLEYHLTSSPEYGSSGVKFFEEIESKDSGGHVVHKMELERTFALKDSTLDGGPDSLWSRVQGQMNAAAPAAAHARAPGDKPEKPEKPQRAR
jgi:hypothetical protein